MFKKRELLSKFVSEHTEVQIYDGYITVLLDVVLILRIGSGVEKA